MMPWVYKDIIVWAISLSDTVAKLSTLDRHISNATFDIIFTELPSQYLLA